MKTDEEIIKEMMGSLPRHKNILPSAENRRSDERRLNWPEDGSIVGTIDDLLVKSLDSGIPEEAEKTAEVFRIGFPELFGGVYEDLHFPSRYHQLIKHKKIFIVQDPKDRKIASARVLTPTEKNMSVEFSLVVTHPDYRGRGLATRFARISDNLVEGAGIEYGCVYCASFHKTTQRIFAELGFKKEAELRGFVLANTGNGNYARDNAVMMSKFYNGAERLCPLEMRIL